jgi:hypothetical protein
MKNILPLIIACFSTTCFAQSNIILSKGQKFLVDNTVTAHTTQTLMGQSMESNAVLSTNYSIEVKDAKDSSYNLLNTFTKMKLKMSAMGNDMNFDSDKKEDMAGEYAASFKNYINHPKVVEIDKGGKILNKISDSNQSSSPDAMKMMIQQMLGDPEETGYGVTIAFVPVPSKMIAGYSWTDSSSQEGIQRSTTYTVKEIKGKDAVIAITGTLVTDTKAQMQGMDLVNKSKGNIMGVETVDITSGLIKEKTTTLLSSGTVTLTGQGLEIPVITKISFASAAKPV